MDQVNDEQKQQPFHVRQILLSIFFQQQKTIIIGIKIYLSLYNYQLIKLMSLTVTKSISQLSQAIEVKDVVTFSLNIQHLNQNFILVKQCLIKMHQIQGSLGQYNQKNQDFGSKLKDLENSIRNNEKDLHTHKQQIIQLQNNIGDQFKKTIFGIESKTKNMCGFEQTVSKLQKLNKFMTRQDYNEREKGIKDEISDIKNIKKQFQRYVSHNAFESFKDESKILLDEKQTKIKELNQRINLIEQSQHRMDSKVEEAFQLAKDNQKLIKQINFAEMMDKMKKFKEQLDSKMNDLIIKMKKKVGSNELVALQQTMIEKLDKFLSENQKSKAQKIQTRQALLFLEKRIFDIESIFAEKAAEDEKDALFSIKKWQCASCTKDLGKYEGKLGQYRPWSIFPCKELDPQKTGGFGYMSYLDKVNTKKESQQRNLTNQRMNKTFNQTQKDTSPKKGSTTARMSNLISNYGSQQKNSASLKDVYFRQARTDKGQRGSNNNNKFFRVKKQSKLNTNQLQKVKQA